MGDRHSYMLPARQITGRRTQWNQIGPILFSVRSPQELGGTSLAQYCLVYEAHYSFICQFCSGLLSSVYFQPINQLVHTCTTTVLPMLVGLLQHILVGSLYSFFFSSSYFISLFFFLCYLLSSYSFLVSILLLLCFFFLFYFFIFSYYFGDYFIDISSCFSYLFYFFPSFQYLFLILFLTFYHLFLISDILYYIIFISSIFYCLCVF